LDSRTPSSTKKSQNSGSGTSRCCIVAFARPEPESNTTILVLRRRQPTPLVGLTRAARSSLTLTCAAPVRLRRTSPTAPMASARLGDIDWRAGELAIHGKGDRIERASLPSGAGAAVGPSACAKLRY
jgi:hypothetical protein